MPTPLKKKSLITPESGKNSVLQQSSAVQTSSQVNSAAENQEQVLSMYANIPQEPTQKGPEGILYDFCYGLRVKIPEGDSKYHVTFTDNDSENVVFASPVKGGDYVVSNKKYFVNFRLSVYRECEKEPFFVHDYDAKGKVVLAQIPGDTLGDTIGWFSYMERFQEKHGCELYVTMRPQFIELFQPQYPKLHLVTKEEAEKLQPYACYNIGLFWGYDTDHQVVDHRLCGNHRTAGWILGVDPSDIPPRVNLSTPRKIKEPYVVIATHASTQCKFWNNPGGWMEVIKFLHEYGYKVVCCDRNSFAGQGIVWNQIPFGVDIDDTGDKSLQDRIDMIKDADFFIGLGSGLSWIAWMTHVPVVLISGMSDPVSEFETPYRVINRNVCNSCWNDVRYNFDHNDFLWCPRHKNTPMHFECTKGISSKMVIDAIKRIPAFQKQAKVFKRGKA